MIHPEAIEFAKGVSVEVEKQITNEIASFANDPTSPAEYQRGKLFAYLKVRAIIDTVARKQYA